MSAPSAAANGLEALAAEERLLVAIDDVQWLDAASRDALAFALGRVRKPVLVLLARRLVGGATTPADLEQAFAAGSVDRVRVGPLSIGAIQRLLRDQLERVFARPTLLRIHESSGGNPFYALELARALGSDVDPARPLPVPETLEGLVGSRLEALPAGTRDVLAYVAALGTASPRQLAAAGADESVLEPARSAGVIADADAGVRFTHPLLASVLYQALEPSERRRIHEKLSGIVEDPLDRARHLALSTDEPDATIAATVEDAAALAGVRGAPSLSGELGEHAFRRTPLEAVVDAHRRAIAAAHAYLAAGEVQRARRLTGELDSREPGASSRADVVLLRSELELRSMLELDAGRWALATDYITREREIVRQYGRTDYVWPFVTLAELAVHRGELETACELAAYGRELAGEEEDVVAALDAIVGLANRASGEPEKAIERFVAAERVAEICGWAEPTLFWWRGDLAEALVEVGRIDEAVRVLDAWETNARRLDRDRVISHVMRCRGIAAAARGDVDGAIATLELALARIETLEDPFGRARALLALGVARRRARRRRAAREAIGAALAAFEELGEATWTKRARAELGRIGGRRREEGLTPAEKRVAALVAEGRTNREVAAALVLGERTVETHLTHIYAKLGVRSRTELARTLASQ